MAEIIHLKGFENLMLELKKCENLPKKSVFILFCGSKNSDGKSWCFDCVTAEPIVHESVKLITNCNVIFIHCDLGPRDFWKDKSNVFRTDERLKIAAIPTLLKWGQVGEISNEMSILRSILEQKTG